MPSVIGSPASQYTPPSSNDESSGLAPFSHSITSASLSQKPAASSASSLNIPAHQHQDQSMPGTPASPPSSGDDSPTTSGGDITFLQDDTEMLDYDNYTNNLGSESSPDALFFGARSNQPQLKSSRFTSSHTSPEDFSPYSTSLPGLKPNDSSPEFIDLEGDSPEIGQEMRGLRLNSRFGSPAQGTVRLEDVMLPIEETSLLNSAPGSLFESNVDTKPMQTGLFQAYLSPHSCIC
jgi:hypothetical protein